jgi:hypothetical protein
LHSTGGEGEGEGGEEEGLATPAVSWSEIGMTMTAAISSTASSIKRPGNRVPRGAPGSLSYWDRRGSMGTGGK